MHPAPSHDWGVVHPGCRHLPVPPTCTFCSPARPVRLEMPARFTREPICLQAVPMEEMTAASSLSITPSFSRSSSQVVSVCSSYALRCRVDAGAVTVAGAAWAVTRRAEARRAAPLAALAGRKAAATLQ